MKLQDDVKQAEGQSRSTVGLERKTVGLAEFIERVGGFKLLPYQRSIVAAVERGEKLPRDSATLSRPFANWKSRYDEYAAAIERSNDEIKRARDACEQNNGA